MGRAVNVEAIRIEIKSASHTHSVCVWVFSAAAEMATVGVTKAEVLSLYRSLLRTARQFSDYNIREYTKRRTIDGFHQNKDLTDPSAISAAYSDGKAQLEVAKRQALIYSLYAPSIKSVMEVSPH